MKASDRVRLKKLEEENRHLKKIYAGTKMNNEALQEVMSKSSDSGAPFDMSGWTTYF